MDQKRAIQTFRNLHKAFKNVLETYLTKLIDTILNVRLSSMFTIDTESNVWAQPQSTDMAVLNYCGVSIIHLYKVSDERPTTV